MSEKQRCIWIRSFDNHFNISCVDETKERANGEFKGEGRKWDFKFCPYCGYEIIISKK